MVPIEKVFLGATGNKLVRIAFDEIDVNVELRTWCRCWDNCAPEVIVKALGGHMLLLDPFIKEGMMKRVNYETTEHPEDRVAPFLICRNIRIMKIIQKRLT